MKQIFNTTKKHLINIPGKRFDKKYIVFESDDWGSERIPSSEHLRTIKGSGIDIGNNPFNCLDSLEGEEDLAALYEILGKIKDYQGNSPLITANTVMANPDFDKIKSSNLQEYFFENTLQTYKRKKGCENSFRLIQEGIQEGYYHPQFHGREHLNVNQWMSALQKGNQFLKKAFDLGVYGIDLAVPNSRRDNFMAAFDFLSKEEKDSHLSIISEGLSMFEDVFKFSSKSFIAPCYVWHPIHEKVLYEKGVYYLQGLPVQLSPGSDSKFKRIYHYQGQKNKYGQRYFVRNCFFEPSLNPDFDYVNDCLKRMKTIFSWGKPAIIGTHRINFIGSIKEDNRTKNLKLLSELLQKIKINWPDVEFITSDKLGELY